VDEMVAAFDKRRTYMVQRLNDIEGFRCFMPKGAFYTFPDVSGVYGRKAGDTVIADSSSLASYLLETAQVAVVAGSGFGTDENIRLSYAISFDMIEKGLDRIQKAVEALS
jgi:aspartate aminotransferase